MTKKLFGLLLAAAMLLSPAFADAEMGEATVEMDGEAEITEQATETGEPVFTEQPIEIDIPEEMPVETDGETEITEQAIEIGEPVVTEQPAEIDPPAETFVETDGEEETTEPVIETDEPKATEQPAETEVPTETEKPTETETPIGTDKPAETEAPAETQKPIETDTPIVATVRLTIDNKNVYEGMERAYKDGYVPTAENGVLTVILPLIADGAVRGNTITVTPQLGDAASSPIQVKNYQKSFELAANQVNEPKDGKYDLISSYLVRFDFPLVADRKNRTYSLVLEIEFIGADGAAHTQIFTCYYTITDGQSADSGNNIGYSTGSVSGGIVSGGVVEETPESKPKVIISGYSLNHSPVPAGETFTATVTLENTSANQDVQNMLVTVSCSSNNFVLVNPSSSIYVDSLKAGECKDIDIAYTTDLETPPQRYTITLAMEYDDSDAVTMTSQGTILVEVVQTPRIELSPFQLESSVNAGETFQMAFQVMNLGRSDLYNVRVEIDVPGLNPVGTAFIGDLAAGTSGTEAVNVFAGMISTEENAERYGLTSGVVRLIYEDSTGTEYSEETPVVTTINELVIAAPDATEDEQEQTRASQWWISVLMGAVAVGCIAALATRKKRKHENSR